MRIVLPIGKNMLMGNDVPERMEPTNENENRNKIAIFAERVQNQKNYSMASLRADKLKCLWKKILGVPILQCLGQIRHCVDGDF
jgi:PhnB protein